MKLKDGVIQRLGIIGQSHMVVLAPIAPCMITGLNLVTSEVNATSHADFELGWSGFTFCSSNEVVKDVLVAKGIAPFAFEGSGYISISKTLLEDFDKLAELPSECLLQLTQLVVNLIGGTTHPPLTKEIPVVVQLGERLNLGADCIGYQCYIMCPVDQGSWLGLYHIHELEIKACTAYLKSLDLVLKSGGEDFSPSRTLN